MTLFRRLQSYCQEIHVVNCRFAAEDLETEEESVELSLKTRKSEGNVIVLDVAGKLSAGEPVLLLRNAIQQNLEEGARRFLIDLGNVTYIDSSGLGALITTFTSVRSRQGDVKLLNLTKRIRDLLQITKLLTVFEVFDDEAKAVGTFKG